MTRRSAKVGEEVVAGTDEHESCHGPVDASLEGFTFAIV